MGHQISTHFVRLHYFWGWFSCPRLALGHVCVYRRPGRHQISTDFAAFGADSLTQAERGTRLRSFPSPTNGAAGQVGDLPHWGSLLFHFSGWPVCGPWVVYRRSERFFSRPRLSASNFYKFRRTARLLGLILLPKPSVAHDFRAAGGKNGKGLCLQWEKIRKRV